MTSFTDGTYRTDSDIYAMGSKLVVDLLQFHLAHGRYKLLKRKKSSQEIMDGSDHWSTFNLILFFALSGCDFIPRLFCMKIEDTKSFMKTWKDPARRKDPGVMFMSFL